MSDSFAAAIAQAETPIEATTADDAPVDVPDTTPAETEGSPADSETPSDAQPDDSPEDSAGWQKRYEEQQKLFARQQNELGELRKLKDEWESQAGPPDEPQQLDPLQGYTPQQIAGHLEAVAAENPMDALQQAVQFFGYALEAGNTSLARRIARATENSIDSDTADKMLDLIDEARVQQRLAPIEKHYQESSQWNEIVNATDSLVAEHPVAAEYAAEIKEIVENNPAVADLLNRGYVDAAFRTAFGIAAAADPKRLQNIGGLADQANAQYKQATSVPTGDGRITPSADSTSPEESAIVDMLTNARVRRN